MTIELPFVVVKSERTPVFLIVPPLLHDADGAVLATMICVVVAEVTIQVPSHALGLTPENVTASPAGGTALLPIAENPTVMAVPDELPLVIAIDEDEV